MSRKKPILGILLIITVVIAVYGASVVYSVVNIGYQVGDVSISPTISLAGFPPEYSGYVTISAPVTLENNGFYDVKGLEIDVVVTSTNWEVSSILNGVEIARGENSIGSILSGETWSGNIGVNITKYIPNFAVEDCTLLMKIIIKLTYQPLIDIPLSFTIEQSEPYLSPF